MEQQLLSTAVQLAVRAGDRIMERMNGTYNVGYKSNVSDLVTDIDRESEQGIKEAIHKAYPDHRILSEESGYEAREPSSPFCWIIDPLDGTTNFVHQIPSYCVSIAVKEGDELRAGVIYDPSRKELFTAAAGQGAKLNGSPIRVSQRRELRSSVLHTGFCAPDWMPDGELAGEFRKGFGRCRYLRISGSAALDLAYVAAGRIDGFWQRNLSAWDIAAGVLLVKEAGGEVTTLEGKPFRLNAPSLAASNGVIHRELKGMLNS